MSDTDVAFASIERLHGLVKSGALSREELVGVFLDRIDALNGTSRAFITVLGDRARGQAARAVPGGTGVLGGIPYAVKDMVDVEGVATTAGSRAFHDNVAGADAEVVENLGACGAVCIGKANLHEFAHGATGQNDAWGTAVNAFDTTRLAGGSSSGSAAAVAFGLAPAALGTDTGGSVRVPAALSGLVGLKPTMDLISTAGVIPYSWTMDHVGIMSRTVNDAAILLGACVHRDPDHYDRSAAKDNRPLHGVRIGIPRRHFYERIDDEILTATDAVRAALESAGARVEDVDVPDLNGMRTVALTVQMPEALSYHMTWLEDRGDLYGADFRAGLALGQTLLAEHYIRAKRMINVYRREINERFRHVDLLLTPTTPAIAPPVNAVTVNIGGRDEPVGNAVTRCTTFFNLTGHPAITVPSGLHSAGLPMAAQLVGRYFDEPLLFRAARVIETEDRFRLPRPGI